MGSIFVFLQLTGGLVLKGPNQPVVIISATGSARSGRSTVNFEATSTGGKITITDLVY